MKLKLSNTTGTWIFPNTVYDVQYSLTAGTLVLTFPVPIEAQACKDWLDFYWYIQSTVVDAKITIGINPGTSLQLDIIT